MTAFFIYLFKACFWVAIWWLIYRFFLRQETFFSFNRIYLMTGLAVSLLIPFLKIYYPVEIVVMQTSSLNTAEIIQTPPGKTVNNYSILFGMYIFFGAFLVVRQLFMLYKINRLIRSAGFTVVNNCRLVDLPDTRIPFSFFNCIFLNFRKTPEDERKLIIEHERFHIKQRHWIDLAIAECIRIFMWFNPFAWFYQNSIKENHEYLADRAVVRNGHSPACYRAALINQSLNTPVFQLVNSFSNYKFKRISMMKKENSNPLKKLTVLLLVPVAGFFFWAFAEPEYRVKIAEPLSQPENVYLPAEKSVTVESPVLNDTIESKLSGIPVIDSLMKFGNSAFYVLDTSSLYLIDGKKSTAEDLKELKFEQIESFSILKADMVEKLLGTGNKNGIIVTGNKTDGIIVITTKKGDNKSPDFSTKHTTFEEFKSIVAKYEALRKESLLQNPPEMILIDGIESDANAVKRLVQEEIESFSILKGEKASELYGAKARGGIIVITTKK